MNETEINQISEEPKVEKTDAYKLLLEAYGVTGSLKLSDQDMQHHKEDSQAIVSTLDSIKTKLMITKILVKIKKERPDVYELLLEVYGVTSRLKYQDMQHHKEDSQAIASTLDSIKTKIIITQTLGKIKKERPDVYELLLEKYGMSGLTGSFKLPSQDKQQIDKIQQTITQVSDYVKTKNRK